MFPALSDWAEKVSARRALWFKVFWVVVFSVLPFNVRTKGTVSEHGEIEISGDAAKVAVTSKPFVNEKVVTAKTLQQNGSSRSMSFRNCAAHGDISLTFFPCHDCSMLPLVPNRVPRVTDHWSLEFARAVTDRWSLECLPQQAVTDHWSPG